MNPLLQLPTLPLLHQQPKSMPTAPSPVSTQGQQPRDPLMNQVPSVLIERIDQAIMYLTNLTTIFVTIKDQVAAYDAYKSTEPNTLFATKRILENDDNCSSLKMTLATISFEELEEQLHEITTTFNNLQKLTSKKNSCDLDFTFERLHSTNDKESPKSDKSEPQKKFMLPFPIDFQHNGLDEQNKFENAELHRASPVSQKDFSFFSKEDAKLEISSVHEEEELESFGWDLKEIVAPSQETQYAFQGLSAILPSEAHNCSQEVIDLIEALNGDIKPVESHVSSLNNGNCEIANDKDKDKEMSTDFSMEIQEVDIRPPKEPEGAIPDRILAALEDDDCHPSTA